MDEITFNLIKLSVADYYDDNHCLVMLKVLFKDDIDHHELSNIADTMSLLNALYNKGVLRCNDLTFLYNTIRLTGHFALQDKIKATWTSFPNVREIAVTEFTEHRQKLMRFGQQVIQTDVRRIDGLYNTPTKNYKNSWEMIHHLEDRNDIKEDMTEFIARLKQLDLPKAVDALEKPIQELDEEDFNELITEVSDWWRDHGNIHMLRVLLSEFTTRAKITLHKIERINTTFDLLDLLQASGLLKPTDIDILVEATNLCGLQGVQEAIAKIVKSPNFDVPYKNFSDHRRKLIALGQQMNTDNMITICHLKGIKVNDDTDPFWLILKLEMKGTLDEGEKMNKFIKLLEGKKMNREVEALRKLSGEPTVS
ncbi:uncharacterized protein [Antedon mediterranea]|uniref:uncharacterized protein isoform X2 n=1 Tax=Antedon mediterranea TaxID=105859 RepID=UPI003AF54858